MRLKSIKISGFKSFVDPTTVIFPSNLCGVVGPNGCGKSNVIDVVRWVMGEMSAKNLRGDQMSDVIFNGSSARKPVGQAHQIRSRHSSELFQKSFKVIQKVKVKECQVVTRPLG